MKLATARIKSLKIAPRKVRLILDMIRNKKAVEMMNMLKFSDKKAAKDIIKLINSALASAKEKEMDEEKLIISKAQADEGLSMKRRWLKSRGRATGYKKSFSNVTLCVSEVAQEK